MDVGLRLEHRDDLGYDTFFGPRLAMLIDDLNDKFHSIFSDSICPIFEVIDDYFSILFVEEVSS